MNYGYSFKDRLVSGIKRFFIKTFIILVVLIGGGAYFFKSDFGNSVQLVKDFKDHANKEMANMYESQTTDLSNAVRKDLGLQPVQQNNQTPNIVPTTPKVSIPDKDKPVVDTPAKPTEAAPAASTPASGANDKGNTTTPVVAKPAEVVNNSGVTKEEALAILQKSSQLWTDACGITFEYKGDKLADYVNNKNVIGGATGIIKWETQMEGSAIGEAHVGNARGPAPGFVLALFSDFFVRNKADLVNTVTHEMGHVIGLEHSANKNSVMFPTERPSAKLQESDKAMCRYFRYRWSGLNQAQSQEKAGVLSNGGYDGSESE